MIEVVEDRSADLDLLRGLPEERTGKHTLFVLACSLGIHAVFLLIAIRLPSFTTLYSEPAPQVIVHRTPLYMPRDLMTQRAPNRNEVSKSIDLASLLSPPAQQTQRSARQEVRRRAEKPSPAPAKPVQPPPAILPEAPKVAESKPLPAGAPSGLPVPPPPPASKPVENPFQNVGSVPVNPNPTLRPRADVQSAIQGLAQERAGRNLVISDENDAAPMPAVPGTPGTSNNNPHAAVELQSDPQGADFRAYLTQILGIVRGNWKRVIPESARMGQLRGRTTVEFIIDRDGKIPKMVIANSSGSDPLDRAAGAGLSMSDPLPPLPKDYRGFQVRLAFTFSYNVPTK